MEEISIEAIDADECIDITPTAIDGAEECIEITPTAIEEYGNATCTETGGSQTLNESVFEDEDEDDDDDDGYKTADDDDDGRVIEEIQYSTPDGKRHKLNKDSGPTPPPAVGMIFKNWEAVERYFRSYAKQQGFGIVRAHGSYRQRNGKSTGERRTVTWSCERAGKKDTRQRVNGKKVKMNSLTKTGVKFASRKSKKCECPVLVYAGRRSDGDWEIRRVVLDHEGHSPTPHKSKHVAMFRLDSVNSHVRKRLFIDLSVGVKLPLIHRALAKERNGLANTSFTERDLRNVAAKRRRMKINSEGGDANAMVNYFKKMKAEDENFFHVERVDEIDRLKDIMWVDARSRTAYLEFSDVVCFDTTYLTNKYKLAFGNFVGVNHHGQTTLFGCALLSHENSKTFEWLFSTWLRCMGGVAPRGFLTDQCEAMRKALRNVMPDTRHRWCLWHILQKFCAKLGSYVKYEDFKVELNNTIYDSLTPEEFNESWSSTIVKYNLEDDDWLTSLHNEAEMWVPAYMKHIFWAGMKTTQRCESINSFFDGYVQRQTMLHEFAPQYSAAIEARIDAEEKADADCERNVLEPVSDFRIELEFQTLYTTAKFYEFQVECMKIMYANVRETSKISEFHLEHLVEDRVWCRDKNLRKDVPTERTCEYKVLLDVRSNNAWCTCKLLECHGIVCRHLIKVFDVRKIRKLPAMFILDRWRKDIERSYTKIKVTYHDQDKTEEVQRIDRMQLVFDTVSMLAAENEDETDNFIQVMLDERDKLIQTRAEASRSKAGENAITEPGIASEKDMSMRSKEDENTLVDVGGKFIASTPSSVGNKKVKESTPSSVGNRRSGSAENSTPPQANKLSTPTCITTPGAAESVGMARNASDAQVTPLIVKDPPVPKNPRNRPVESRYKSAIELNTTAKGKGKATAASSTKTKKGQAKQIEECALQLQQQQAKLDLFIQQQASIQQAHHASYQFQQAHQQQQISQQISQVPYSWVDYSNFSSQHVSQNSAFVPNNLPHNNTVTNYGRAVCRTEPPPLVGTPLLQRPAAPRVVGCALLQRPTGPPSVNSPIVRPVGPSPVGNVMVQTVRGAPVRQNAYAIEGNVPSLQNSSSFGGIGLSQGNPFSLEGGALGYMTKTIPRSLPDLNQ